ncbi:MAG: tetratricopeptide repeat protein [Gemmatimonadota bacterium]|nr:tetratricopeptide repeat protein [Gemmatimonadota bacterium]
MNKTLPDKKNWIITLVLILLVAAALRFSGIGWGVPARDTPREYHPDERMAALVLSRMRPDEGQFNPYYFINPTLFYYQYGLLLAPVCKVAGIIAPWQVKDYSSFVNHDPEERKLWFYTGRALSILMGIVTVWGVFWLGALLGGRELGLVAAAVFAVVPAHVIQSHYMVVDSPSVMWMVLSVAVFLKALKKKRASLFALSGLLLGLGTATKYTAILAILPQAVLAFQAAQAFQVAARKKKRGSSGTTLPGRVARASVAFVQWCGSHWHWLALWAALAAAGFLIGCPYSILDRATFMGPAGIGGLKSYNVFGFSLTRVFAVHFFYSLGPPLALVSLAGLLWIIRRPGRNEFSIAVYLLASILILVLNASSYMRHFVPFTPFLALCCAHLALELNNSLQARLSRPAHWGLLALGLAVFIYTSAYTLTLLHAMGQVDPRTRAERWITENVEQYRVISVIQPEWGEDFYSVQINKDYFSRVVTGHEYRLVEAFKPDYIVVSEYDLNHYQENSQELDFQRRLASSPDYVPIAVFNRRTSFMGLPIYYHPPATDYLYFCPNITIYGRKLQADSSRAYYLEGMAAHDKNDLLRADSSFVKAAGLDEDNPLNLYWLSMNRAVLMNRYIQSKSMEDACEALAGSRQALDRVLEIHPRIWMRVETLGVKTKMMLDEGLCLNKLGRKEEAVEIFKKARECKSKQKVLDDSLSNVTLSTWDVEYNKILRALSEMYIRLGRKKEAAPVLIELVNRDNKQKDALLNLGNIFLENPITHPHALKLYKRALELYPDLARTTRIAGIVEGLEKKLAGPSKR